MNLSDPTRAVTPTLDGTVLAVLAAAGKPLTVGQVADAAARGSEIGIRRSLGRLVVQGIVRATLMGRNTVHELNREHVAAEVAVLLAGLRNELWQRLRHELTTWRPRPVYACVFGSAARGDGDEASDIDLLLVHPPFSGEPKPGRLSPKVRAQIADALRADLDAAETWESQVDQLRSRVEAWTGNAVQVVDLSFHDWQHPTDRHRRLLAEVERDRVDLVKMGALTFWSFAEATRG